MTLRVYTARLSYRGADAFNVTRGSGTGDGLVFAPSNEALRPALALLKLSERLADLSSALPAVTGAAEALKVGVIVGAEAWKLYSAAYAAEMKVSYLKQRPAWDRLLAREVVTLACYCDLKRHGCHRVLLAFLLTKCGAVYEGERP